MNAAMTLPTTRIKLQALHPAQRLVARQARRYNVIACGRRWGKTTLSIRLIADAVLRQQPVAYFAPTYKLLLETWRELVMRLTPIASRVNASERRIETVTGGVIECWSLDDLNAGRGRRYGRVIIDEAALVRDLDYAWRASIRPTLADLRGDAWFFSTPRGKQAFYELFRRADYDVNWFAAQQPTTANPFIDAREIDAMRESMPEQLFRQEILAEFLDEVGAIFRREHFRIVDAAPPNLRWTRYWDLAVSTKTSADYTASAAVALAADGTLYIRDVIRGRWEWPDARRVIVQTMLAEPDVIHGVEEALHGAAAVQELRRDPALARIALRGVRPERDKMTRALAWAARAEAGKVALVRGAWISAFLDECAAFDGTGRTHDDQVDAVSGAMAMLDSHMTWTHIFEYYDVRSDQVVKRECS